MNESIKNIEYMRDTLDLNLMNELVTDIYTYEKTTLMGSQQSVGTVLILQNDLSTFSKFVKVCGEPKNQYELLKNATDDELIVIFSAKGKFFDRVLSQKNILNRKNIPKIYLITVSDVELPPFVNKKIQLYDKYNYSSNILFTLYVALIAINYKQAYLNA